MVNLSLVIPTRNCPYLKKLINSTKNHFNDIIVVGSSLDKIENSENLRYFHFDNLSASKARNIGYEKAKNDYILFIDSDCLPQDNFFDLIKKLKFEEKKIYTFNYSDVGNGCFLSDTLSDFIRFRLKNQNGKFKKFSSFCFIINKNFFNFLGKFNDSLYSFEDIDLSVRANLYESDINLLDKCDIVHLKKYSVISFCKEAFLRAYDGQKIIYNNQRYFKKCGSHIPSISYFLILPFLFLFLSILNLDFFLLFFLSLFTNYYLFKDVFNSRKNILISNFFMGIHISFSILGYLLSYLISTKKKILNFFVESKDYLISLKRVLFKSKYPVQVIQYVTARCNLRCEHCFYKETLDAKDPGEIEVSKIVGRVKNIAPFLWYSITGGEVFIRKDFKDLVLEIHKNLRPKFFSFPTNGWYTERTFNSMLQVLQRLDRGNIVLFFSIDGPENIHDNIRGRDSFKRLKETFFRLKKLEEVYPRLHLNIVITVQDSNYHLFPSLINEIQNEFDPTAISINLLRYHSLYSEKINKKIIDGYESAINQYEKIRIKKKYNFFLNSIIKAKEKNQKKIILNAARNDKFTTYCSAGNLSYVIMENGNLKPCEILDDVYGNILNNDSLEIISNKNLISLNSRKKIKKNKCRCTYECANSTNALFNFDMIPGLLKTIFQDTFNKISK